MKNSILIIVPTLNSYKILPKLVDSLLRQSSKNWRLLFIDGESNLTHRSYLINLEKKYKQISYIIQNKNDPYIYGAMNVGFKSYKSNEWLIFWGSDDWAYDDFIIEKLEKLINSGDFINSDLIFCDALYMKSKKRGRKSSFRIINNNLRLSLFLGFSPPHQGVIFSPNIIKKKNSYTNKYYLASDLDYFLSVSKRNLIVKRFNQIIVKMSKGGISGNMIKKRLKEVLEIYKNEFGIYFFIPLMFRYIIRFSQILIK